MIAAQKAGVFALSLASHLALIWFGLHAVATPMGDITTAYQPWFETFKANGALLGINASWVYPLVALPAILVPGFFADLVGIDFQTAWLTMSVLTDLIALGFLLGWRGKPSRARITAALAWISLQFMLGPVAISRLDNLSVALAIIAVAFLIKQRSAVATAVLTVATWLKVWPAALLLALLASDKKPLKIFLAAAATSASLLLLAILAGGNWQVFSFLTAQTDRGIQVEAPIAMPWLWQRTFGDETAGAYFSMTYLTFQVQGVAVDLFAKLMSWVMLFALSITGTLAWLAHRRIRHTAAEHKIRHEVFAWVAFTATLDLMVFNKVGSPQYFAWLFIPLVYALLFKLPRWRWAITGVAALMPLTWMIYPVFYDDMLAGGWVGMSILTVRNLLEIALLVLANVRLTKLAKGA